MLHIITLNKIYVTINIVTLVAFYLRYFVAATARIIRIIKNIITNQINIELLFETTGTNGGLATLVSPWKLTG